MSPAAVPLNHLKQLREQTQAPLLECRAALEAAGGDFERAAAILRQRGSALASKRADKSAREGRVESYIHLGKIGVLVEVNCETDFVAKTPEFAAFCKDVAMQVAAAQPASVAALLAQPFIKDEALTIRDHLNALVAKTGEKVVISRFTRFQLGDAPHP